LNARRFAGFKLNLRFALSQYWLARYANRYIKQAGCDVVHVHTSVAGLSLVMLNRNLRKKLFYTSHATRRTKDAVTTVSSMDKAALRLENEVVKRARCTITLNDLVREKLISATKIKPERVISLPVIVDTEKFSPVNDTGNIRKHYGLDGKFVVLYVGRIRADKGVEYLVKSADIVINKNGKKDVVFLLVGPTEEFGAAQGTQSPYLEKMKCLVAACNLQQDVKLTGPLPADEIRQLYAACDIFVLPSLTEAMPAVVLEAMASGKAVIATSVGGIPLQVKSGENGLLINPADEKALAAAIIRLKDNPAERKKMGLRGREIAKADFSADKIAQKLIKVYEKC
jgi:glycosyltransferase involved in cell wall biosynthesis